MESAGCARRSFGTLGDFCGGGSGNLDLCDHSFVETKDNTVHAHKESVGTEEEKKNTLGNLIEWCARRFSGSIGARPHSSQQCEPQSRCSSPKQRQTERCHRSGYASGR
jgi:hypothetical protein